MDESGFRKFETRKITPNSVRRNPDPMPEAYRQYINEGLRIAHEPFVGVTTDGKLREGLYPLVKAGRSNAALVNAANAVLNTLSDVQKRTACHGIDANVWRMWTNTPRFALRHGVMLEDFSLAQRELFFDLMRASLSARGFEDARATMKMNEFLGEYTGDVTNLGEWVYFLSFYGTPSATEPWGWQIDGHHLIINCFVIGGQINLTPLFFGAEPLVADAGKYKGTRLFDPEQAAGLELIRALTDAQRKRAILYPSMLSKDLPEERKHPADGRQLAASFSDNRVMPYEGICARDLSPAQGELLEKLIATMLGYMPDDLLKEKLAEIRRHFDETWFCWIGGADDERPFFFKVQNPVIVVEFDHHKGVWIGNTEPERFHGHLSVRTPNGNDYGKAWLKQYVRQVKTG